MPDNSFAIPQQDTRLQMPSTAVKEVPLTGRRPKILVFAPVMGYKWFKVISTVNAPL